MSVRARSLLAPIVALALLAGAALNAVDSFDRYFGVDYYHLWGVGLAHRLVPGDPYAHVAEYSHALADIAAASPSSRLRATSKWRETIQPTGTPFFYAVFDLLPADFDLGVALLYAVSFAVLIAAVYAMARMRGAPSWAALALGAVASATFNPFVHDMANGNVTTLQLGAVVAAVAVAHYRLDARWPAIGFAYLPALALFVVFKPNTAPVAAALGLHYALAFGRRATLRGLVASAAAVALAWLIGVAFFGDVGAWNHWYRYTQGMHGGTLLYNLDSGNLSLAMLMAERSHVLGPYGYGALLGAALALFLFAAITDLGKRTAGALGVLRRLIADPWCAAAVGVLVEFAITPLMWPYYRMLALVPVFWLFRRDGRWDAATAWTVAAYVLMSRPLTLGLIDLQWLGAWRIVNLLAWLPLVPAMCARLAAEASGGAAIRTR